MIAISRRLAVDFESEEMKVCRRNLDEGLEIVTRCVKENEKFTGGVSKSKDHQRESIFERVQMLKMKRSKRCRRRSQDLAFCKGLWNRKTNVILLTKQMEGFGCQLKGKG